jgi:hypothetical protein
MSAVVPEKSVMTSRFFCGKNNQKKIAHSQRFSNKAGGDMKTLICILAIWLVFFIVGMSPAQSQAGEDYTFITGERGPQICVGSWIPPRDVGLPGFCDGQLFGLSQLSAISAKQTVDRLDQLLSVLASIDQRLAANNDLVLQLIESTANTQSSIEQQVWQGGNLLRDAITQRFDDLPKEILANDLFKEELSKLKEDILGEVEKQYLKRPSPPAPSRK